jgi:hypothetical protein
MGRRQFTREFKVEALAGAGSFFLPRPVPE